jgi:hypothetical protein
MKVRSASGASTIEVPLLILGTDAVLVTVATDASTAAFQQGTVSAAVLLLAAASAAWAIVAIVAFVKETQIWPAVRAATWLMLATIIVFAAGTVADIVAHVAPSASMFAAGFLALAITGPGWVPVVSRFVLAQVGLGRTSGR